MKFVYSNGLCPVVKCLSCSAVVHNNLYCTGHEDTVAEIIYNCVDNTNFNENYFTKDDVNYQTFLVGNRILTLEFIRF